MTWLAEDLRRIVETDDLHIAPCREDGVTSGTPTWIWCVAVGGELYVRATAKTLVGTRPHRNTGPAGSLRQASRGMSPSSRRMAKSTTGSTMRTEPSTPQAPIWGR